MEGGMRAANSGSPTLLTRISLSCLKRRPLSPSRRGLSPSFRARRYRSPISKNSRLWKPAFRELTTRAY